MSVKKIYESDSAKDLWRYYDESEPLNVGMIGFTDCTVPAKGDYRVERKDCRFTALEYVREGKGIFKINGKEYRPCAGSVMVLTKGSDHSYYPDPRDPWKKDWITLDGALAESLVKCYLPTGEYCFENCDLSHFFSRLRTLAEEVPLNYTGFVDNAVLLLCDALMAIKNLNRKKCNRIALAVKSFLDTHIEGAITIEEIAEELHYSPNYVIRQFKSQYGCTPYKYYTDRKLKVAQLYLRNTGMSISEIAERLHFADQHYFSNAFRQHCGMSAGEYRKKFASSSGEKEIY
ncbi:MAG TPA: AraC family transcriptional regulator [Candidatus Ornithoclostridium faecavium]|nr:AraC family transcriptional regulator [Candidatus Ornithoclostridium faecavium]